MVSSGSKDVHFIVYIDKLGKVKNDDYNNVVVSGFNTMVRLDSEYIQLSALVFKSLEYSFKSDIACGNLSAQFDKNMRGTFIPDGIYDIRQIGAGYGKIIINVHDGDVSPQCAAEIMIKTKSLMDEANVPFYSLDLFLTYPGENCRHAYNREYISARDFLYSHIYDSSLAERIQVVSDSQGDGGK